jgi:iron complex transport system substrate-binding protein
VKANVMTTTATARPDGVRWRIGLVLFTSLLVASACRDRGGAAMPVVAAAAGGRGATMAANTTSGCIDRFDEAIDYFPDKSAIENATNFSVGYHRSYKVVTVHQTYLGGPMERYVLLQCGAPRPHVTGDLAKAAVIAVPIASLFSSSTTHLPVLVDLDRVDVLTGVSKFDSILSPPVLARIRAGHVIEFAPLGVIDAERVVSRRPSVLMTGGSDSSTFTALRAAGVPVVANAEWLEPTALGRAEWIKYMALYLNDEKHAGVRFAAVKNGYRSVVERTSAIAEADRPRVMTGRASRGSFAIAGGRSYVAALIKDAGARYVWADNTATGTATVDLEAQIQRAADADIWINGGGWKNLASMVADEPRYAEFKAFRHRQVWVYERLVNAGGANDYWSRSVTRPDLLLADLVTIFHPGLVPDHRLEWYVQVPSR